MTPTNSICIVIDFTKFKAGEGYAFNNQIERRVNQKLIVNYNGKYEKTICKTGNGVIYFADIHDTLDAQEKILDVLIDLGALDKLICMENHTIELVSMEQIFNSSKNYTITNEVIS